MTQFPAVFTAYSMCYLKASCMLLMQLLTLEVGHFSNLCTMTTKNTENGKVEELVK